MDRAVQVRVNGELREVRAGTTLAELLGEPMPGSAAAVNSQVVPGSQWGQYQLQEGDRVEFVRAVQGG
ncbi:MAG: sulfur carrier protein ThiS [Armatimonadota bacterium]|nr:sulfur carrier protein ThiS [Armatimonadota bacterium]